MEDGIRYWIVTLLTALTICQQVASQEHCKHTWLIYSGWNVLGGVLDNTAKTIYQCRTSCLQYGECTGFDFDGQGSCWIIFPFSGGVLKRDTSVPPKVTHYELLRNINSCTDSCTNGNSTTWTSVTDANVAGGTKTGDGNLPDCVKSCTNDATCTGFDWVSGTKVCWHIKGAGSTSPAAGVMHFDRQCATSGTRIVTPGFIPANQAKSSVFSTIQVKPTTQGLDPQTRGPSKPTTSGFPTGTATGTDATRSAAGTDATRSAADSENVVYIRGQAIKPAYIVLAGLGAGCILLVIIAVIVLCIYPLRGDSDGGYKEKKHKVKKVKKVKKQKDVGELHTRRPKTLSEEEHIGMSTVTTTVNRNSYDGNSYNKHKSNGSTVDYDRRDSGHGPDSNHRDSGHEYNHRDSAGSIRKSGGYEDMDNRSHGDRDSIVDKAHDRVNSMTDDATYAKDDYNNIRHSANDNASYIRDEYD